MTLKQRLISAMILSGTAAVALTGLAVAGVSHPVQFNTPPLTSIVSPTPGLSPGDKEIARELNAASAR